jgi:predicted DNA-binding transcriptional regulator AlpA
MYTPMDAKKNSLPSKALHQPVLQPGQEAIVSPGERVVGFSELLSRLNLRSRSTIYSYIKKGLIKKPGTIGKRNKGWGSTYVDELVRTLTVAR